FRGPLLLAWDQHDNDHDEFRIPRLDPENLNAHLIAPPPDKSLSGAEPWILLELQTPRGPMRLRDYATAGMNGTRYRSWLHIASASAANSGEPPALHAALTTGPEPDAGKLIRASATTPSDGGLR